LPVAAGRQKHLSAIPKTGLIAARCPQKLAIFRVLRMARSNLIGHGLDCSAAPKTDFGIRLVQRRGSQG
jgi:hypothetical protein